METHGVASAVTTKGTKITKTTTRTAVRLAAEGGRLSACCARRPIERPPCVSVSPRLRVTTVSSATSVHSRG